MSAGYLPGSVVSVEIVASGQSTHPDSSWTIFPPINGPYTALGSNHGEFMVSGAVPSHMPAPAPQFCYVTLSIASNTATGSYGLFVIGPDGYEWELPSFTVATAASTPAPPGPGPISCGL